MRYSIDEHSTLVGQLPPDRTVKIELLNLKTDSIIDIDNDVCLESEHMKGIYIWNTSKITQGVINGYTNILYKMYDINDNTKVYYGKIVLGGYVDDNGDVNLDGVITDLTEVLDTLNIINMRL